MKVRRYAVWLCRPGHPNLEITSELLLPRIGERIVEIPEGRAKNRHYIVTDVVHTYSPNQELHTVHIEATPESALPTKEEPKKPS